MKLVRYVGFLLALFGAIGFSSSAMADLAQNPNAKDLVLKGDAKCTGCHDESDAPTSQAMLDLHPSVLAIGATKHGVRGDSRTPTCTNCHGDSDKHIKEKGKVLPDRTFRAKNTVTSPEVRAEACLTCHKGTARTHWEGSQHQVNDVTCSDCHRVHAKEDKVRNKKTQAEVCYTCHKEQRADSHKISTHPLDAGKIACSDCHNPHGSTGPKLMKKNTLNETCWSCHAEKRGPFLWEHQPASEDCANCHTPHGSNITPLLKNRPPMLCDDCHDGPHNSQAPYGKAMGGIQGGQLNTGAANNPNSSASGRACMNCHAMVHGSNSPAGALLHR
jgi:DmsE family decaheme c-type cytochrome